MDEILKDLDTAFKAVSTISVSGDAVDAIALARAKLRNAYASLQKIKLENDAAQEDDSVKMKN